MRAHALLLVLVSSLLVPLRAAADPPRLVLGVAGQAERWIVFADPEEVVLGPLATVGVAFAGPHVEVSLLGRHGVSLRSLAHHRATPEPVLEHLLLGRVLGGAPGAVVRLGGQWGVGFWAFPSQAGTVPIGTIQTGPVLVVGRGVGRFVAEGSVRRGLSRARVFGLGLTLGFELALR